jgi:pyrroline-5-carboxylate reductase
MKTLGFIGLGHMGGAIAKGLAPTKMFELWGFDPNPRTAAALKDIMYLQKSGQETAWADFVLLAVKPQIMRSILTDLAPAVKPETCIISIAAGITVENLQAWSGGKNPVVRVMPNTPAMVGKGVYALCLDDERLNDETKSVVMSLFAAIGQAHVLSERLFDAYTGLIGSGPAYVFAFMEALIDAGVTLGLDRTQAANMVKALVTGSATMAEEMDEHLTILREMVTSPGGTTIAGLNALDKHGFRFALNQAVMASAERSKELGAG